MRTARGIVSGCARQQGAMAIAFGAVLLLGVLFAALVLDVGRWYMEDRRLQKAVDTIAMQYAMHGGYCGGDSMGQTPSAGDVEAALVDQDLRNPVTVVNAAFGFMDRDDGVRQFVADGDQPEAFLLQARQEVPRSIVADALFPGTVTLEKTAVARRVPTATFAVGSWLARIDSEEDRGLVNMLLEGLLGGEVDLDLVSYQGLAATRASLGDLLGAGETVIGAEAGTLDGLLGSTVNLGELGDLVVTALERDNRSTAAVDALVVGIDAGAGEEPIRIGDILVADQASENAALDTELAVGDLLLNGIMLANGQSAVDLDLSSSIDDLVDVQAQLAIIEAPQMALGPPGYLPDGTPKTEARTAQLRLQLEVVLDPLGLGLAIPIQLAVEAASASGIFEDLTCRTMTRQTMDAGFSMETSAATVAIGAFGDLENPDSGIDGGGTIVGDSGLIEVTLEGTVILGEGETSRLDVTGVDRNEHLPQSFSVGGSALSSGLAESALSIEVEILQSSCGGGLLGSLTGSLCDLVNSLANTTTSALSSAILGLLDEVILALIEPLLELLGINVAGADVELIDLGDGRTELIL